MNEDSRGVEHPSKKMKNSGKITHSGKHRSGLHRSVQKLSSQPPAAAIFIFVEEKLPHNRNISMINPLIGELKICANITFREKTTPEIILADIKQETQQDNRACEARNE